MALAEVTRPHGVRGEVRVKLYNSDSELLSDQAEVLVKRSEGNERMMALESVRGSDVGHLLAKFEGVDDRDEAERLRGALLSVRRDAFPPLEDGEFYVCDVVGARLVGPSGELGSVQGIASYPTADSLVVKLENGHGDATAEIPLLDDFIELVDVEAGRVVLRAAALEFLGQH